jgi:predicted CDP-diglyceride synthetase/phosphatidate cytidylyltransferase
MTKMRARAGQALVMALDMGLCDKEDERERYAEARRRAWWMTVCLFLVFLDNGELIFFVVCLCMSWYHCQKCCQFQVRISSSATNLSFSR